MKKLVVSLALVMGILVGCNHSDNADHSTAHNEGTTVEVKADIQTPEKVAVGKDIDLLAHVTQGGENVDDADEVKFEVWESGDRDHAKMFEGKLDKDGIYKATTKFEHDGVYYMYAHTTARGLHTMPKKKITAGHPDMSKVKKDNDDGSMKMDMNDSSKDDH
jgi:hypothetical protein